MNREKIAEEMARLKGTETEKNLLKAFAGESLDQRAVHGLGHIVAGFSTNLESALAEIETFEIALSGGEARHE